MFLHWIINKLFEVKVMEPKRDWGTMKFEDAIGYVRDIQKEHPRWYLCGSVALIALGILDKREVHDIDFSITVDDYVDELCDPKNAHLVGYPDCAPASVKNIEHNDYIDIRSEFHPPCCLFVMGEHAGGFVKDGILFQDVGETVRWKYEMGREKGKEKLNL